MKLDRIFIDEKTCKHNEDFFCTAIELEGRLQHIMACSLLCGFFLNFDPVYAGKITEGEVPSNCLWDSWKLNTVAFLSFPDPNKDWKPASKLSVEGSRM